MPSPDAAPPLDLQALDAVAGFGPPGVWYLEGRRIWSQQDDERAYVGWVQSAEWAAFAVATHNGLPALVARVRALESEGCPYCTLNAELAAKVAALEAEEHRLRDALACILRQGPRVQLPTAISIASAALAGNPHPCQNFHGDGENAHGELGKRAGGDAD